MRHRRLQPLVAPVPVGAVLLILALPAAASTWVGENGVVRLAFNQGESLISAAAVEPGAGGTTMVDLYAYLDEVEPMQHEGEAFIAIGGFELKLLVEGAEAHITEQTFPFAHFNVGKNPGHCVVGINPAQRLVDGRCELVHWKILFTEPVRNVTFRLDTAGLLSCRTLAGCPDSGTQALYSGTVDSGLMGFLVGAGCVPAHLNWDEPRKPLPIRGTQNWRDVGVFEPIE